MTFAEFVLKHHAIPNYKTPGTAGWLEFIDAECATMAADYPAITSWDDVPADTLVFIRWSGGNRGMYLWTGEGLVIPDQRPGDTWSETAPPLLGADRCLTNAWMDVA